MAQTVRAFVEQAFAVEINCRSEERQLGTRGGFGAKNEIVKSRPRPELNSKDSRPSDLLHSGVPSLGLLAEMRAS